MFEKLLNNEYSYNYNMNRFLINAISSSRIILGLLFLYVVLFNFNEVYLILIFLLTAISDVGDGWLSRKYCLSTDAGAKFFHGMIPPWFLAVIILKMIEFFKTSDESLEYEKFGHFVALMFYAFPWVSVLINDKSISLILAILITVCAMVSFFTRIHKKVY